MTSHPCPQILHVDSAMLVAAKPAGLLAVPGRGADKADCLAFRVQAAWPDALAVHRLDMATSGLMLFGRGATAQRQLSAAFAERRVIKTYVAVVQGLMRQDAGQIDLPLSADWPRRPRQQVDTLSGRPSRTLWRVLERDPARQLSRLELEPVTGRTHQLRVHLAALGHPILGDALYATGAALLAPRLMLHAQSLQLDHPVHGSRMHWAWPAEF